MKLGKAVFWGSVLMATSGTLGFLGGTKSVAVAGALIAPALLTMCMIKSGEGKGLKGTSQSKVA